MVIDVTFCVLMNIIEILSNTQNKLSVFTRSCRGSGVIYTYSLLGSTAPVMTLTSFMSVTIVLSSGIHLCVSWYTSILFFFFFFFA
jgi:hypothetical protein